jgi:hypothetical protein
MDPGKIASQAGHAYLGTFLASQGSPEHLAYSTLSPAPKSASRATWSKLAVPWRNFNGPESPTTWWWIPAAPTSSTEVLFLLLSASDLLCNPWPEK